MSLEIKYNRKHHIVESIFSDIITEEELILETTQCIALGNENSTNLFLCDASNAIVYLGLINVLELEKIHIEENLERTSKIALIEPISKESKNFASFYETACLNRGWNVKIFQDRQTAIGWLQER